MVTRETAKEFGELQLTRQSRTGSMRAADDLVAQEQVDPAALLPPSGVRIAPACST